MRTAGKSAIRDVAALCAALTLAFAGHAAAQSSEYAASDLPGGLTLISGPDGNVVAGLDAAGLTLIDSGSQENAEALLRFIQSETGSDAIAQLVLTHWHPHVTGLIDVAAAQGAQVAAHDFTYQYLKYGVESPTDGDFAPVAPASLPNMRLYDDGGVLPFGEDEIRIGFISQAHTDGDVYAYFPGANVLVTGGAVRSDGWNMIDWWSAGYFGGLLDGLSDLLEVADENTVIVPASGPVMTKAELQAQFDMYTEIYDRLATMLKSALSPDEAVAAKPTADFHPEWADADQFVERAFRSYYAHLRGNPRLGAIP
jgi:glyoxylase-like metal-dependent hydrolase (beta-lactamase superfamily II)